MKNIVKLMVVAATFSATTLLANDFNNTKMDIDVVLPKTAVVSELPVSLDATEKTAQARYSPEQIAKLVGLRLSNSYVKKLNIDVALPHVVVVDEEPASLKTPKKVATTQYNPVQLANMVELELTAE